MRFGILITIFFLTFPCFAHANKEAEKATEIVYKEISAYFLKEYTESRNLAVHKKNVSQREITELLENIDSMRIASDRALSRTVREFYLSTLPTTPENIAELTRVTSENAAYLDRFKADGSREAHTMVRNVQWIKWRLMQQYRVELEAKKGLAGKRKRTRELVSQAEHVGERANGKRTCARLRPANVQPSVVTEFEQWCLNDPEGFSELCKEVSQYID